MTDRGASKDPIIPPLAERRPVRRRKVLLKGIASDEISKKIVLCQVRDISSKGARIALARHHEIPPRLLFVTTRDRIVYVARVAWRRGDEIGLEFLQARAISIKDETIPIELVAASEKERTAFLSWS